jgi:hypothetical protein
MRAFLTTKFKTMNKLLNFTKWAFTAVTVVALVFIYSCSENGGNDPDLEEKVEFTYSATDVEVGETATIPAITQSLDVATFAIIDDGGATFVTVDTNTGELTVGEESTTGSYAITVESSNDGGESQGIAEINITVNADFDPSGKSVLWKYWMNNTADVVMINLNLLPGQEALPDTIPIPVGWPAGWPAIDLGDPTLPLYFTFPTVQYFLMQVPGDDACDALDPAEESDTLLVIVNSDLTLSTQCKNPDNPPGTVTDLGTSSISYIGGGFVWSLNLTLQGVPATFAIGSAEIAQFTDPLDPHWEAPSGTPRTFPAIVGTVEQYLTPTDFHPDNYLSSLQLLNVDVVLEVLE